MFTLGDLTLETLRERASHAETVFYSVTTCWWTLDPQDLGELPSGIPCDPRGGVLMEGNPVDFVSLAEKHPEHYGKHGLRAFVAAYHGQLLKSGCPWCFRLWDAYNEAIDVVS